MTAEQYALLILLLCSSGVASGLGNAALAAKRNGKMIAREGWYYLAGIVSVVYGFLGLTWLPGVALFMLIPLALAWFGGKYAGSKLFPIHDLPIAATVVALVAAAPLIYHFAA